jgi:endoglucanase
MTNLSTHVCPFSQSSRLRLLAVLLGAWRLLGCASTRPGATVQPGATTRSTPAGRYGQLQVIGTQLCDAGGRPVQLRGMSTSGLQWYGEIVNEAAFTALARDWQVDVVRLALYVGEGGYRAHPELKQLLYRGIELAIRNGLYVVVDWHVLSPGDPNDPLYGGAQAFFAEVSQKYGKLPNLLYEIMNEPNGTVVWDRDLKPYAEKVVATIRANDPDNIILIGSATWSQDVDLAAVDPVQGKNLMYTFHFYAGSHGEALRAKVQAALDRGVAVFCSEWGTSEASGSGGPYLDKAEAWLAFLDRHHISWINWSLCDKSETSAALKSPLQMASDRDSLLVPETRAPEGYAVWSTNELSASGAFVRVKLKRATGASGARVP